eukprot:1069572_1
MSIALTLIDNLIHCINKCNNVVNKSDSCNMEMIKRLAQRSKVNIEYKTGTQISVIAMTPRLTIRPVQYDDIDFFQTKLYGAQEVMNTYGSGNVGLFWNDKHTKEINYAKKELKVGENDGMEIIHFLVTQC